MLPAAMTEARQILRSCRIGNRPLFFIGTFHTGVTVLSQQVRALNLAWAFVEDRQLTLLKSSATPRKKVAIVGAGFAGVTFAAALLEKGVAADITIFEERDTLIPMQQGSDSRWLHPRIYDWPADGSESSAAMLPVLNWTAARASDVAVQILAEWKRLSSPARERISLFCNSRHLQVHEVRAGLSSLWIEWVGEERDATDGTMSSDRQMRAV
jgi:hypothetical protein